MNHHFARSRHVEPGLDDVDYATVGVTGSTLVLTGEIDTTVMLAWQREHPSPPPIDVVDATAVTFMNSAGIAYLITLAKRIAPGRLTVRSEQRAVLLPLHQMGIHFIVDITP